MADPTCARFDSASPLDPNGLNRFVVGADPAPRPMKKAEMRVLGDPVASLFAKGKIPRTAEQTVEMVKDGAPRASELKEQRSFVVAEGHEGSEILPGAQAKVATGNLRFVVTLGSLTESGPDVFVSASNPKQPNGIEVMAWDRDAGGFNWYRSTGDQALWMFAGNSRDALRDLSRRQGPFNSHPSGSILMKELKTPWIHWDSPAAKMRDDLPRDARRTHPWFRDREPQGAIDLEIAARAAMERWAKARFEEFQGKGGTIAPRQIMEQILDTSTANLHSTHITNASLELTPASLDLPRGFFVDADAFSGVVELPKKFGLGLDPPPLFEVSPKIYANCLKKFNVRIEGGGVKRAGDAHFCFVVPERAFEDQVVLREAMAIGLVSKRLAASLLMVDPWNPVFSERRRALLQQIPATATITNGRSSFSQEVANRILAAAKLRGAESPEAEFAKRWNVGPQFAGEFNKVLGAYYRKVQKQLKTQSGFEPYFKLAETRRRTFANLPIAEFPLLLPISDASSAPRSMQRDGTVTEG